MCTSLWQVPICGWPHQSKSSVGPNEPKGMIPPSGGRPVMSMFVHSSSISLQLPTDCVGDVVIFVRRRSASSNRPTHEYSIVLYGRTQAESVATSLRSSLVRPLWRRLHLGPRNWHPGAPSSPVVIERRRINTPTHWQARASSPQTSAVDFPLFACSDDQRWNRKILDSIE